MKIVKINVIINLTKCGLLYPFSADSFKASTVTCYGGGGAVNLLTVTEGAGVGLSPTFPKLITEGQAVKAERPTNQDSYSR